MSRTAKVRPPKNAIVVNLEEAQFAYKETIYVDYTERDGLLYQGSILSAFRKTEDGPLFFLVTYKGWGPKYNEYIEESKIIRDSEEARERKRQLDEMVKQKSQAQERRTQARSSTKSTDDENRVRASRDTFDEGPATATLDFVREDRMVVARLPLYLRAALLKDYERAHSIGSLLTLPRPQTVAALIDEYLSSKGAARGRLAVQCMSAMVDVFDAGVAPCLLYASEVAQLARIKEEAAKLHMAPPAPSHLYGVEHLLRLITRLGPMVRPHFPAAEWAPFKEEVEHFVAWLGERERTLVEQRADAEIAASTGQMVK